jgi:hypothetical protein
MLSPSSLGPQTRAHLANPRLAERRQTLVSRVLQDTPHSGPIPVILAARRCDSLALQSATHLTHTQSIHPYPFEDPSHDASFLKHDLIASLPITFMLAHVTIAIGRTAEDIDLSAACGVSLATTASLQDLGPLIFRYHSLNLQQQVLFR